MVIDVPGPIDDPLPQPPSYQVQVAPAPRVPPDRVRVVALPSQTGLTLADTDVAAVETLFTVIVIFEQAVVLQVPSART